MKRSLTIAAALLCGYGTLAPLSPAVADHERRYDGDSSRRAFEIAERRLRDAERAHERAKAALCDVQARHQAAARELAALERKLADCRPDDGLLRRLQRELQDVQERRGEIERELSYVRARADEARRATDAARADYLRRAECSPQVLAAKDAVACAAGELERARHRVLDGVRNSHDYRRAAAWRDDVRERLDRALYHGTSGGEAARLKAELADAQRRLDDVEGEALACDGFVRDAERRLADAQRGLDGLLAQIERDAARDPAYCAAKSDAERLARDAADLDRALCAARESADALARDVERLRGSHYAADYGRIDQEVRALRSAVERLSCDVRDAAECAARAERDARSARVEYQRALADYNRSCDGPRREYREEDDDDDDDRGRRYERGRSRERGDRDDDD